MDINLSLKKTYDRQPLEIQNGQFHTRCINMYGIIRQNEKLEVWVSEASKIQQLTYFVWNGSKSLILKGKLTVKIMRGSRKFFSEGVQL